MRLPSKVTAFRDSSIAMYPTILSELVRKDESPYELYIAVGEKFESIADFLEVVDELYALGKVKLIESRGLLHYVD